MHWVEMLPDTQTPSWLGLPSNAEKVLLTTQGTTQPIVPIMGTGSKCNLMFFPPPSLSEEFMPLGQS